MDALGSEPKGSLLDCLNLTWVHRLLTSSVGRKFIMALTGLGLCGFLVVHLAGNLFLYVGAEAFNKYAHKLHEQEWLPLAEAGLFALFALHIYLAVSLTVENRLKRRVAYARKESKIAGKMTMNPPSNWMFISGAIVLGFLCLHIVDMKLQARPDVKYVHEHDSAPYANTVAVLKDPVSRAVYMLGTLVLGFHLAHGFSSAFQSLGLNHPKYTKLIWYLGILFAVAIAAGFCSLPLVVPGLVPVTK